MGSMAEAEGPSEKEDHRLSIIFVLGGPGSGKTTQCDRLCGQRGFTRVNINDIVHVETMKETSKWKSIMQDNTKDEDSTSIEMMVEMLKEHLLFQNTQKESNVRFVIDGKPLIHCLSQTRGSHSLTFNTRISLQPRTRQDI